MEIYGRQTLCQRMISMKEDPLQRHLLTIILKYEMQSLLQRLSELGEESVVIMASLVDGHHSALASDQGEKFLHNQVVSLFKEHFVTYLRTGSVDTNPECKSETGEGTEEPETFMHMKKHQIEQYNRRRDKEDKSIDETVSRLVQNILKEGKEKERVSKGQPDFNPMPGRRKRSIWYPAAEAYNLEYCSKAKRKQISSFFPSLSRGSVTVSNACSIPVTSPFAPVLDDNSCHSTSVPENDVVTIKIEPIDDGEYGGVTTDSGSQVRDSDSVNSNISNQDCVNGNLSLDDSVQQGSDVRGHVESPAPEDEKQSDNSDNCQDKENKDKDIELPFVEEFYQRRNEDVKLLETETSPNRPRMTCYKQSRKKSNTFNLVLDGYSYIKDKQGKGGTLYWKCGRGGCKGRVIQRGEELIISQVHIHEPAEG